MLQFIRVISARDPRTKKTLENEKGGERERERERERKRDARSEKFLKLAADGTGGKFVKRRKRKNCVSV